MKEETYYYEIAEEYTRRRGITEYEVEDNKLIFVEKYDYELRQIVIDLEAYMKGEK